MERLLGYPATLIKHAAAVGISKYAVATRPVPTLDDDPPLRSALASARTDPDKPSTLATLATSSGPATEHCPKDEVFQPSRLVKRLPSKEPIAGSTYSRPHCLCVWLSSPSC